MEPISIEGTQKTPTVNFNHETGKIEIKGRSIPENSIEFYKPLVDWLEQYGAAPQKLTEVNVQLEYFNTSSSKCLFDLFKMLSNIHDRGNEVTVAWYYVEGDDDMLETGQDFESLSNLPFKMIIAPKISFD